MKERQHAPYVPSMLSLKGMEHDETTMGAMPRDEDMGHGTDRGKLTHARPPSQQHQHQRDPRVPRVAAASKSHGVLPTQQYVSARGISARRQESARADAQLAKAKELEKMRRMDSYRALRFGNVSSRLHDQTVSQQASARGGPSAGNCASARAGESSSIASAIASGRLNRQSSRQSLIKAPSIAEIQQAIQDRPHLTAQIQALHRDPDLSKEDRLLEIGRLIRQLRPDTLHTEPSELEKKQSAFACTPAQKHGRRTATQEQVKRVREGAKKKHSQPTHNNWRLCGGEAIEELLDNVDLVDARYLLGLHAHGGSLPCWQVLPDCARINRSNVWRLWGWQTKASLPILVLSAPWLDDDHPDREGEQLASLAPILRTMLAVCGGDEFTVGVLWDYASLPQPSRSPNEHTRFIGGLRNLMMWYAHPYTHVLLLSDAPTHAPSGAAYTNVERTYEQRGWCELERKIAALATARHCLWEMSQLEVGSLPALSEAGSDVTADLGKLAAMRAFDVLRSQLTLTNRAPPMAPDLFSYSMRKRVEAGRVSFLAPDDLNTALEMYEAGFVSIFENYRKVDPSGAFTAYQHMGWGALEAKALAAALQFASEKCKLRKSGGVRLRFEGNHFEDKGEKMIRNAVQFSKVIQAVLF